MIIPLGFLNEIRVDEKTGKVYHEKLFEVRYIGRVPAEMRGNGEKTIEYMIGKGWVNMLMRINDDWRCYIGNGKAVLYKGRTKMATLDVSYDLGNAVAAVRRWCIREGIIRKWETSDGSPTATV